MTPLETVNLVRMLLDEARESFVDINFINNAINDAILITTRQKYMIGDERYLRPLYSQAMGINGYDMQDGETILTSSSNPAKVLYPRSCRLFKTGANKESIVDANNVVTRAQTTVATYLENERYFNYVNSTLSTPGFNQAYGVDIFPRSGVYTIRNSNGHILHFVTSQGTELANLWYIKYPDVFLYIDNDVANSIGIEVPDEYHPAIAMKAAERINDIDVEELERGDIAFQNQRIDIESSAL